MQRVRRRRPHARRTHAGQKITRYLTSEYQGWRRMVARTAAVAIEGGCPRSPRTAPSSATVH